MLCNYSRKSMKSTHTVYHNPHVTIQYVYCGPSRSIHCRIITSLVYITSARSRMTQTEGSQKMSHGPSVRRCSACHCNNMSKAFTTGDTNHQKIGVLMANGNMIIERAENLWSSWLPTICPMRSRSIILMRIWFVCLEDTGLPGIWLYVGRGPY